MRLKGFKSWLNWIISEIGDTSKRAICIDLSVSSQHLKEKMAYGWCSIAILVGLMTIYGFLLFCLSALESLLQAVGPETCLVDNKFGEMLLNFMLY